MTDLALALLKSFERFEPRVYLDPVGIPTIGFGHMLTATEAANLAGKELSRDEAGLLLATDFEEHQKQLLAKCPGVQFATHELEALTSWVFNLGVGRLAGTADRKPSTLHKLLMAGAPRLEVARQFLLWVYGGDPPKVLPGLVRRRHVEAIWFLGAPAETLRFVMGERR